MPNYDYCFLNCVQHCLVHLGDIARYRSQTQQAESFYRHAIRYGYRYRNDTGKNATKLFNNLLSKTIAADPGLGFCLFGSRT